MFKKKGLLTFLATLIVTLVVALGVSIPKAFDKAFTTVENASAAESVVVAQDFEETTVKIKAADQCSNATARVTSNKTQGSYCNSVYNNTGNSWFRITIYCDYDVRQYTSVAFDYYMEGGLDVYVPFDTGAMVTGEPQYPAQGTISFAVSTLVMHSTSYVNVDDGSYFDVVLAGAEGKTFYIDNLRFFKDTTAIIEDFEESNRATVAGGTSTLWDDTSVATTAVAGKYTNRLNHNVQWAEVTFNLAALNKDLFGSYYYFDFKCSTGALNVMINGTETPCGGSGTVKLPASMVSSTMIIVVNAGVADGSWWTLDIDNFRGDAKTQTITAAAGANGSVSPSGTTTYAYGTQVRVKATPSTGYHFTKWSDNDTTQNRTVRLTSNVSITANFAINTYTITVKSGGNGTVSGGGSVNYNGSTTIKATPNTGYHFVKWSDGNTSASRTISNVKADATYTATFEINTYTISVSAGAGGTVSGGGSVNHGGSTTINATPNTGYHFVNWDDGNTSASRTISNVTASKTYTATFAINTYTISATASPAAGGSISGTGTFDYGSSTTLTATPNSGYRFGYWGSTTSDTNASKTINNIASNQSFTAVFIKTYVVTFKDYNGTTLKTQTVDTGKAATAPSNPSRTGYTFTGWDKAFNKVTSDLTITAQYSANNYDLTISSESNDNLDTYGGKVSKDNSSFVYSDTLEATFNASVTVYAKANTGFTFDGWYSGDTRVSRDLTYTYTYTTVGDSALTAKFNVNLHKVYVSNYRPYSGTVYANQVASPFDAEKNAEIALYSVAYGHAIDLVAVPDAGWRVVGWYHPVQDGSVTIVQELTAFSPVIYGDVEWAVRFDYYTVTIKAECAEDPVGEGGLVRTDDSSIGYQESITFNVALGNTYGVYANPNEGFWFEGFFINGVDVTDWELQDGTLGEYYYAHTQAVDGHVTIIARFAVKYHKVWLTNARPEQGYIATGGVDASTLEQPILVAYGHTIDLEAIPAYGYHFVGWYDYNQGWQTIISDSIQYSPVITDDIEFGVVFDFNQYTINLSVSIDEQGADDGVTWTVTPETKAYAYLRQITVSDVAHIGYEFLGWYENSALASSDLDYAFQVTQDRNLVATWQRIKYEDVFVDGNGSGVETWAPVEDTGMDILVPEAPVLGNLTDNQYTFVGWYEQTTGAIHLKGESFFSSDDNYYALYVRAHSNSITTEDIVKLDYYMEYKFALSNIPEITAKFYTYDVAGNGIEVTQVVTELDDNFIETVLAYYTTQTPKDYQKPIKMVVFVEGQEIEPLNRKGNPAWREYSLAKYMENLEVFADSYVDSDNEAEREMAEVYGEYARNMTAYCEIARQYFDDDVTTIAAAGNVTQATFDAVQGKTATDFSQYAVKVTGAKPSTLRLMGFTTVHELGMKIRLNMQIYEGGDYTFKWVDGEGNETDAELYSKYNDSGDKYYYVEVADIAARDLNKVFNLKIIDNNTQGEMTFQYSALTYAQMAVAQYDGVDSASTSKKKTVAFAKAMLAYHQTAYDHAVYVYGQ